MNYTTSRVSYEVTADVVETLRDGFEKFMTERHVPEVMATGCFAEAHFETLASGKYRTRYEAISRATLDDYFERHAARLRAHVSETFPVGIAFEREEWETLASFG